MSSNSSNKNINNSSGKENISSNNSNKNRATKTSAATAATKISTAAAATKTTVETTAVEIYSPCSKGGGYKLHPQVDCHVFSLHFVPGCAKVISATLFPTLLLLAPQIDLCGPVPRHPHGHPRHRARNISQSEPIAHVRPP